MRTIALAALLALSATSAFADPIEGVVERTDDNAIHLRVNGKLLAAKGERFQRSLRRFTGKRVIVDGRLAQGGVVGKKFLYPLKFEQEALVVDQGKSKLPALSFGGQRYQSSGGASYALRQLGVQGKTVRVRGYLFRDEGEVYVDSFEGKMTRLGSLRADVPTFLPVPHFNYVSLPKGWVRKNSEVWITGRPYGLSKRIPIVTSKGRAGSVNAEKVRVVELKTGASAAVGGLLR